MVLKVFLWHAREVGEELHPRFVFTEYGGKVGSRVPSPS